MFLDDTACNLASINLLPFRAKDGKFDIAGYEHTVRLWTLVLEVSVMMAQFPSRAIAERSFEYRTLGIGYANIGGLLMTSGIPYDSAEGRAIAGAVTAIMTGVAYATSAEMAGELGPFPGFKKNREHMLRVMRNHRRAAHGESTGYEKLSVNPVPLVASDCPQPALMEHAAKAWDDALALGLDLLGEGVVLAVVADVELLLLVLLDESLALGDVHLELALLELLQNILD
jgi:ribonucleoside-diphosphate reductase alpha chain